MPRQSRVGSILAGNQEPDVTGECCSRLNRAIVNWKGSATLEASSFVEARKPKPEARVQWPRSSAG
jgi:hypothetical protein